MIATYTAFRVPGITEDRLDDFIRHLYDIDALCPDVLDCSVGAGLGEGLIEIEITIDSDDSHAGGMRAFEVITMAVEANGGAVARDLGAATSVSAQLIEA